MSMSMVASGSTEMHSSIVLRVVCSASGVVSLSLSIGESMVLPVGSASIASSATLSAGGDACARSRRQQEDGCSETSEKKNQGKPFHRAES